jgi:hypothetical protein
MLKLRYNHVNFVPYMHCGSPRRLFASPFHAGWRDSRGRSALHLALKHGHVGAAELLADVAPELLDLEDDAGWDPWTLLDMGGAPGRGVLEIKHSTDVESMSLVPSLW